MTFRSHFFVNQNVLVRSDCISNHTQSLVKNDYCINNA